MADELSNLKPAPGSTRKRMRVGRGEGSGKGRTSGRGTKGQHKRGTVRPGFEGGQMPLYRRLAKRGFNNKDFAKQYTTVRLDHIAGRFEAGELVDAESLKAKGLVKSVGRDGIKILGNGEISQPLVIRAQKFTRSAAEKIAAAGGKVETV